MLRDYCSVMGDLWDGGRTGAPFPRTAKERKKEKRNPEDLAETKELLKVG